MNIPSTPKQQGHEHSTPFSHEKPPQLHFPGRPHGARDAPRAAGTRGDRRRADARSRQQPGLSHGMIFETFMLTAKCLEDVSHLHGERALAGLTGFRSLPCAATLGGWLRRVGRNRPSRDVLQEAVAGCWRRPCRTGTASSSSAASSPCRRARGRPGCAPMPLDDGAFSETGSAARNVHVMAGTPEAFCLAV